jgi:ubiquinone/menaquinone biosynthesis C-methylase UbiE
MRKTIKTTRWNPTFDSEPTSDIPRMVFGHSLAKNHLRNVNRILDIGCGIGSYTHIVDRDGCVGIDLDINALKIAKKYCKCSEFIVSSAFNLPFRDETFDIVFMWEVFEEIPVQSEILVIYEVRRLLLRNGYFLLSFSNDHLIANILDPAFIFRGFRHYNTDKFMKLISEVGLNITSHTIRGFSYTLISNFLVFFYKHVLHKKEGKTKDFFYNKSAEELNKENGIVYTFIVAKKEK